MSALAVHRAWSARALRLKAIWLALLAAAGVALMPVLYLVSLSLRRNDDILSGSWLPSSIDWANWPDAFTALPQSLAWYIANSWVTAGGAAVVSVLIAVPGAMFTARARRRGERLLGIALAAYCAPPIIAMVPMFLLLRYAALLNTLTGLVLVDGLANVPVVLWLIDGFVRRVPIEIEEAAWIDGASRWRVLHRVVLPLIWPGVVATALICLFVSYSEFLFAVSFAQTEGSQTLTVALSIFQRLVEDMPENHPQADAAFWSRASGKVSLCGRQALFFISLRTCYFLGAVGGAISGQLGDRAGIGTTTCLYRSLAQLQVTVMM